MSPATPGQSWTSDENGVALDPDQSLDSALELLVEGGTPAVPVVDQGVVVGQITHRDIVTTYKAMLARGVRRARSLPEETALFEVRLGPTSPLVGRTLRDGCLPRGTLVVSIVRSGETIFPSATTELAAGDVVMVVAGPESEADLRTFLAGDEPANVDGDS